jgi:hypothetical protein
MKYNVLSEIAATHSFSDSILSQYARDLVIVDLTYFYSFGIRFSRARGGLLGV